VTWNDYGESHYIGPVHDPSEIPAGSAQFVQSNPHESWLTLLPYYISSYKGQNYTVTNDAMQYWYLPAPTSGGSTAGVVGGTGATDINPDDLLEDKVFVSALLKAAGEVHVAIGNNPATVYQGVEGINHWSQPFNGQTGNVTFSVVRGGNTVKSNVGEKITATTTLADGRTNYNAWVGGF
jgi:glucan endo-1,3-alpha-glucosidase